MSAGCYCALFLTVFTTLVAPPPPPKEDYVSMLCFCWGSPRYVSAFPPVPCFLCCYCYDNLRLCWSSPSMYAVPLKVRPSRLALLERTLGGAMAAGRGSRTSSVLSLISYGGFSISSTCTLSWFANC